MRTGITGAAKALGFLEDEFLDSDFLAFALLAGIACERGRVIIHKQYFEWIFESCLPAKRWLATPSLSAFSSKYHSHLRLLSFGASADRRSNTRLTAPLAWDGALLLEALCTYISDSVSAYASARVEGCASAGVEESSSADEDEASAVLLLPAFLATFFLVSPYMEIRIAQHTHKNHLKHGSSEQRRLAWYIAPLGFIYPSGSTRCCRCRLYVLFASLLGWNKLKGKNNLLEILTLQHKMAFNNSRVSFYSFVLYLYKINKNMQGYVFKSASLSSFWCSWIFESATFLSDTCHPKIRYIPSNEKKIQTKKPRTNSEWKSLST